MLRRIRQINTWDNPWINPKLLVGVGMVLLMVLIGVIGPIFWDTTLARAASSPLNLPPMWIEGGTPNIPWAPKTAAAMCWRS